MTRVLRQPSPLGFQHLAAHVADLPQRTDGRGERVQRQGVHDRLGIAFQRRLRDFPVAGSLLAFGRAAVGRGIGGVSLGEPAGEVLLHGGEVFARGQVGPLELVLRWS